MGQPKLLLPWPCRDQPTATIMDRLLEAWTSSRVSQVVVVVRPDDVALANACRRWPVQVVEPEIPPMDMKASVQFGLEFLQSRFQPDRCDRVFVAPADLPTLSTAVIDRLVESPHNEDSIVVPVFGDRQGHPILIPWQLTNEIFRLGEDEGIDALVERHPKQSISFDPSELMEDVDTPDEYRSARAAVDDRPPPS